MTCLSHLIIVGDINYIENFIQQKKFAIATDCKGVVVIEVTASNDLVLTNISFGEGKVHSVININQNSIALCTDKGIGVYNKETQELIYEILKP